MDEHRLGLQPVVRRQWVDEYSNAIAKINWQFQWLWLYGFVHPYSGEPYWGILPLVNEKIFSLVLEDFAQYYQLGRKKRALLILEQAGWHLSKKVKI